MIYFCCDQIRRNELVGSALNGIDYLEVLDHEIEAVDPLNRQKRLVVHFINSLAPNALSAGNILIEGGERIRGIVAVNAAVDAGNGKALNVLLNRYGDFSIYTLRLVQNLQHLQPPAGIDLLFSAVDFSFKVDCPTDFDCKPRCECETPAPEQPEIDYLAKDYASFRRLMLDRMSSLMPQWQERNPADLGVTMVETLAYVGDYLSYQQDAVATEAYLGTARRRVSVRRHARLVDYDMHDGCNARVWVHVQVNSDFPSMPSGTQLLTRIPGEPAALPDDPQARAKAEEIFETVEAVPLFEAHNEIRFYSWGDRRCCLPKGATHATLIDHLPNLKAGDVLVFEEVLGPHTGRPEDADQAHRHAVRLVDVETQNSTGQPLTDPLTAQPITEIYWAADDALPFPLCISSETDSAHGNQFIDDVSVARGNVALADHGYTVAGESLGVVPKGPVGRDAPTDCDRCDPRDPVIAPVRFRPALKSRPLTFATPPALGGAASAAWLQDPRHALPGAQLHSQLDLDETDWTPARDLLNSGATDAQFVAEVEADGEVRVRFGDGQLGMAPQALSAFTATYRVGNGAAGNVGAESIAHLFTEDASLRGVVTLVRNPQPARGGIDPETAAEVRAYAPAAFRTQERAVTEADYAEVTERHSGVQRAVATFRWTGSWHTVFITVDRLGGLPVDDKFETAIRRHVERYRMAGHDLEIDGPRYISLEIEMHVCALPDYFREDVKKELLELFSKRALPAGRLGQFHPDRFTFAQPVFLSPLIAAAQATPGVMSVQVTTFQRQGSPDNKALLAGKLELGRLEIARCDNDPSFPEHGVFRLSVGGGK